MTTVLCTNLYKAARAVKVKGHKTLPVLNTIHLYHHEGRLALTTFQFEPDKPLTEYVSARWEGETWETCVPAKPFTDWLNVTQNKTSVKNKDIYKFIADQITLTLEQDFKGRDILKITAGNTRAEFVCLKASEFPPCTSAAASEFETLTNAQVLQNA